MTPRAYSSQIYNSLANIYNRHFMGGKFWWAEKDDVNAVRDIILYSFAYDEMHEDQKQDFVSSILPDEVEDSDEEEDSIWSRKTNAVL